MKLGGPQNASEHFGKDTVLLILSRIEPRFLGCPEVFVNVQPARRRSPAPSCEPLQHAGMHICADVNQCALQCHALPCVSLWSWSSLQVPHGSSPSSPNPKEEFRAKGNNKPDLRENRILHWYFAWKRMTRQSNSRPTRGVLPSEADQYKVSSRAQTYRHSIPICMNSWLIFSLSHDAVPMAMCLKILRYSGYYTYHLLEL